VDEFFNCDLGTLKYRSLDFVFETKDTESFQDASVVNYPNDYDFTRITEYKKLTGQKHTKTTISMEYPTWGGEPYYPVPTPEQHELYEKYRLRAEREKNTLFIGRLATYRYYNMDAAAGDALRLFNDKIK
jgi:UDP-galactopyranose mutase